MTWMSLKRSYLTNWTIWMTNKAGGIVSGKLVGKEEWMDCSMTTSDLFTRLNFLSEVHLQ